MSRTSRRLWGAADKRWCGNGVRAAVLEETTSGEFKMKLLGVMISEEAGGQAIVLSGHEGAFERVSDAAGDSGGVFTRVSGYDDAG